MKTKKLKKDLLKIHKVNAKIFANFKVFMGTRLAATTLRAIAKADIQNLYIKKINKVKDYEQFEEICIDVLKSYGREKM
jgi:hypothetical protein